MKTLVLFLSMLSAQIFAQGVKTETFVVKGNCEDCKKRIENAADIKGVKLAEWNTESKVITITYDSEKVNVTKIQEAIAAKGYDAGDVKGSDKAYKKLPKCCQYRDNVCEEQRK